MGTPEAVALAGELGRAAMDIAKDENCFDAQSGDFGEGLPRDLARKIQLGPNGDEIIRLLGEVAGVRVGE